MSMNTVNKASEEGLRGSVALAICATSAATGLAMIEVKWAGASLAFGWVGIAWSLTGRWLGGLPLLWRSTPAEIYRQARERRQRQSPLVRTIRPGSILLFTAAAVSFF
jgi:hypothetical protein